MTLLSSSTLASLDAELPSYNRAAVVASVVHFGVGGFHRAHQALFFDEMLTRGALEWGICGVGVMPGDQRARDAVREQDGLYTLVTTEVDGQQNARVIGSIVDYLYAPDDPERVLEKLAASSTTIVSLTITEGGYGINDATGAFEPSDPSTLSDLRSDGRPCSALGLLAEGLRRRRARGVPPFTIVSCDNIQDNGRATRTSLTSFVRAKDDELANWIGENVAFPSSMVDRITPAITAETRREVAAELGIDDVWPVRAERYLQWVLEDNFPLGRPDLAAVGVQLVDDVEPYELMKLRLLNASHQAMSYLGILAGYSWVHDVCRDPIFISFLRRYMRSEAVPTLRPVPGIDLDEYSDQLLSRFGSEAVRDTLDRQVTDGSDRIPKFLLPVLRAQLATGGPIDSCALVLAAWSLYVGQHVRPGAPALPDRQAAELLAAVVQEVDTPGAFLDLRAVFGELGQDARLRATYLNFRKQLGEQGARALLSEWAVVGPESGVVR